MLMLLIGWVAIAGRAGKVFIADKNTQCISRVSPDRTIHTHAGTHIAGFNGEGLMAAGALQLMRRTPCGFAVMEPSALGAGGWGQNRGGRSSRHR